MITAQQRWEYDRARLIVVIARCQSCAGSGPCGLDGWSGCQVIHEDHIPAELLRAWCQHAYQCPASPDPQVTVFWLGRTGQKSPYGRHKFPGFGGWGPERPWSPI